MDELLEISCKEGLVIATHVPFFPCHDCLESYFSSYPAFGEISCVTLSSARAHLLLLFGGTQCLSLAPPEHGSVAKVAGITNLKSGRKGKCMLLALPDATARRISLNASYRATFKWNGIS